MHEIVDGNKTVSESMEIYTCTARQRPVRRRRVISPSKHATQHRKTVFYRLATLQLGLAIHEIC